MAVVMVVGRVREEGLALLRARPGIELRLLPDAGADAVLALVPGTDAVIVRTVVITDAMMAAAPGLRIIAKHGVGYDNIDLAAAGRRRIPVAITANANAVSVAEHALHMILELLKHGRAFDAGMKQGGWSFRNGILPTELAGKNALVVGFGRIGARVTRCLLAFDARVLVADPYVPADRIEAAGAIPVTLADALPKADLITLHCPLGAETRHLIGAPQLATMKPSAILVNTARGGLVDEAALAAVLASGGLAGAGIDAFAQEPPHAGHPLLALPNALLSPHVAGGTAESLERVAVEAARNVLAALDGRLDPSVVVNPEVLR